MSITVHPDRQVEVVAPAAEELLRLEGDPLQGKLVEKVDSLRQPVARPVPLHHREFRVVERTEFILPEDLGDLIDRFGRRTSRRSDHVAQFGRMPFRLLCIEDRTEHRFDNDVVRNVARESEMNGGIDQCLQDQECVCRSGSADGGGHVEILFIVDLNFLAERLKNHTRLFPLCIVHVRRRRPYGQTLADLRRRGREVVHG